MNKSTKIKICGLTRLCDIDFVNEAQPDFIGFVFAKSRREVSFEMAKTLKSKLSKNIKAVGVFVNAQIDDIKELVDDNVIDIVQLHSNESEDYIDELKSKIDKPIIKAIKAVSAEYILENAKTSADYLLIDAYSKDSFGGTGETFNWQIIPKLDKPFFLAGGLDINNVGLAIDCVNAYCLDVSSGVETDNLKDKQKIFKITKLVKGFENG